MARRTTRSLARRDCATTRRRSPRPIATQASICTSRSSAPRPARRRCCTRGRESSAEGPSRPPPELVAAVFHLIEFLGFLWAIGALVVRRLAGLTPRLAWAAVPLWFPIGGAAGGVLGLVIAGPPRDLLIGAVHLLSAGMWAGGIMVMASLRPPGGWAGTDGRELVERFARVALIAFGV